MHAHDEKRIYKGSRRKAVNHKCFRVDNHARIGKHLLWYDLTEYYYLYKAGFKSTG